MADGKMAGSFGFLSSLAFSFLTTPHCPLRPDCPHVCPHNVSPFHPFSDPCPLCPPCRRLFVAQSTFHHLNFSHAATSLSPPADILLSTFVDTSRPFWDCTDFSLRFRRIIIVNVSDMFTREHGGAFFIEPFLLIYVGGHILSRIFGSCPLR